MTMTEAEHRGGRRSAPAFQFRLSSLLLAMAVCAVLLGLYIGYGLFGVLVVAVIALAALIWVIDAWILMKSYLSPRLHRQRGASDIDSERLLVHEEVDEREMH